MYLDAMFREKGNSIALEGEQIKIIPVPFLRYFRYYQGVKFDSWKDIPSTAISLSFSLLFVDPKCIYSYSVAIVCMLFSESNSQLIFACFKNLMKSCIVLLTIPSVELTDMYHLLNCA